MFLLERVERVKNVTNVKSLPSTLKIKRDILFRKKS